MKLNSKSNDEINKLSSNRAINSYLGGIMNSKIICLLCNQQSQIDLELSSDKIIDKIILVFALKHNIAYAIIYTTLKIKEHAYTLS